MVKKEVIFIFAVILILVFAGVLSALPLNKTEIKECKQECRQERGIAKTNCETEFKDCKEDCGGLSCKRVCVQERKACLNEARTDYKACQDVCSNGGYDFSITEENCVENGGYYESLCNGPYFGAFCTRDKFCMCGGNFEYSCPADYSCVGDFNKVYRRIYSVEGWITRLGIHLGDIGVCAKNPGDGQNVYNSSFIVQ